MRYPMPASRRPPVRALAPLMLAAASACALMLALGARPVRADDLVIRTMGPVSYVCGGVAEDERAALAAQQKQYNIGVLFTQGAGVFLSDVNVRLLRDGQAVAEFRSTGPRCLIRAPEGNYSIEATYKGETRTLKVSTGTPDAQMRW